METINIDKKVFVNLARMIEEINDQMESLELAGDPEFVESMKKSEEQIKNNEVGKWDDL